MIDAPYNAYDCSLEQIANDAFDRDVCPETVRKHPNKHDLVDREPTLAKRLERTNPDVLSDLRGFG